MSDIKKLLRQALKPLLFLLTFIFICAFLAHYLAGDETLLDYARANPELAYGTEAPEKKEAEAETALPAADTSDETTSVNSSLSQTTTASSLEKHSEALHAAGHNAAVTPDKDSAYPDHENNVTDSSNQPPTDGASENPESAVESNPMKEHPNRTTYKEGFFYEELTDSVKERITGISYPESGCTVPYEDLAYVGLLYFDFDGQEQTGELICNKAIAQDMVEIFYELYRNEYQLERVRLIDEYGGDDTASMADNNTSCFNYRVVDGTSNLSKHAYGLAIDVNPYYNPYVVFGRNADGSDYISPPGSEIYADRSQSFAYKIDENDLCYRLFAEHGFTWGGNWNSSKDYQHFQKAVK